MASPVMGVLVSQSTITPSLCSRSFPLNAPHLLGKKAGRRSQQGRWCVGIRAEAMATEKLGVKVLKNPPEEKLAELGVRSWPKAEAMATEKLDVKVLKNPPEEKLAKPKAEAMATEKLDVKVLKNPTEEKLAELGVRSWPKWGCPPGKYPVEFTAKETCYLLQGKVKVFPEGHGDDGYVEIEAGDLVEFPKVIKCTWDVSVAIDKHYSFE